MNKPAFAGALLVFVSLLQWTPADPAGSLLTVDYESIVSRADITYNKPVTRSEEGLPVGNGRMGSLVWTTPAALKFQINRVDVFAENGSTHSFPERHTDTLAGCGYVDINLVDFGDDVFTTGSFQQHLAVYDGLMTARGKGVTARTRPGTRHPRVSGLAQRVGCGLHSAGPRGIPGQLGHGERTDRVRGNPVPGRRRVSLAQPLAERDTYVLSQREESRGSFGPTREVLHRAGRNGHRGSPGFAALAKECLVRTGIRNGIHQ